jgi:hypothetical protein
MTDANWVNIDVAALPEDMREAYETYKVAQRQAAALREAFETLVSKSMDIPAGQRMVFGYRFGKLSAAIVEDDRKPSKAKQSTLTLGDFLAAQASGGHRA